MLLPAHLHAAKLINSVYLPRLIVLLVLLASVSVPSAPVVKADSQASAILVKDIRAGKTGSYPSNLTNVNGTLLFSADDGIHGEQLWMSNGIAAGTILVKVINPYAGSNPISFTAVNGVLFFTATDGMHGQELWKSNGTTAGTFMVKDINPGSFDAFDTIQDELVKVNNELFFAADDGIHGQELWKSDGTAAGTVLVKDIYPGSAWSQPDRMASINQTLFFEAEDRQDNRELWQSDGTGAHTFMVADINPLSSSDPYGMTKVNNTLFFAANDGVNGKELWKLAVAPSLSRKVYLPMVIRH